MKLPEDSGDVLELTAEDIVEVAPEAPEAPEAPAPRKLVGKQDPNTGLFMLVYEDDGELYGQYTKSAESDAAFLAYNKEHGIE